MCKIVVSFPNENVQERGHFCYIRYDIGVIFAARQRVPLQVLLLRERRFVVILLGDAVRFWSFSLRYVTFCGICFLFHGCIETFIST